MTPNTCNALVCTNATCTCEPTDRPDLPTLDNPKDQMILPIFDDDTVILPTCDIENPEYCESCQ